MILDFFFQSLKRAYEELGVILDANHWEQLLKKLLQNKPVLWEDFEEMLRHFLDIMNRKDVCSSVIPDLNSFEKACKTIFNECKSNSSGKLSDLYPFLTKQDPKTWAVVKKNFPPSLNWILGLTIWMEN